MITGVGTTRASRGAGRRLRVLFVLTSRQWGGNEKWTLLTAEGLMDRGHDVCLLWSHPPVRREAERRGIPGARVRLWGDVNPVGFIWLCVRIAAYRPDVIVLTKQREYWMGGAAARVAGGPMVVLRLGLKRRLSDDLKRKLSFGRFSDAIIVNSTAVRDALRESSWLDAGKVALIENGVPTDAVEPDRARDAVRRVGVPEEARIVLGAGRLSKQKGFDVLIDAFAQVRDRVPGVHLVLAGGGRDLRKLTERAAGLGIGDAVHLPGHVDDVRALMAASDVYVLSSRNEGMANTLLEAMSVGAPIVATDVSGTAEAVRPGREALVVPPEDVEALATAIERVLSDDELAERLGGAARERARSRFGVERMLDDVEELLVGGTGRRGDRSR
ncbi:MAG: glycosyltransferase [Candidatus Eisenbacteria bacterium]|nr:glycosyltransferase [Candidatus Eisenbacteria bacterium]